jgi:rod shape determining protein RodA
MFKFDRRLIFNFDLGLSIAMLLVAIMGLANLFSATYVPGAGVPALFIKQLYYYLFGFLMIMVVVSIDYRVLLSLNYPFYGVIILLLAVALFFGDSVANTQRWINLGIIRLQPSEPAKLAMVITMASYFSRRDTGLGFGFKELLIPMGLTVVPFLLILKQPDLGTAMMMMVIFGSMALFVKVRWKTLVSLGVIGLALLPIAWLRILKPYQKNRILTLFDPSLDPQGTGYHIAQSKIAVGSGLMFGQGFLRGTQAHLDFLPENHTDFAFSVWAEEWGFFGCLFFLACYCLMVLSALRIAAGARDKFGMLLAYGIVALLFWQAFINLAMIMGLLPVVGMPLPLFSYGGSSLLTNLIALGILLNIGMRRFQSGS